VSGALALAPWGEAGTAVVAAHYVAVEKSSQTKGSVMLRWAIIFFVVSLVAGLFGFTGISAATAGIARILFFLFLVIFLVFLVLSLMAGNAIL
jgi:uncharacterized membrane protein YtjA (UPF0391 family)